MDEHSCFFRNEDGSLVQRSSYEEGFFDLTKRKVIQYIDFADDHDLAGGHGTVPSAPTCIIAVLNLIFRLS